MSTGFSFILPHGFGPIPLDPEIGDREDRARRLLAHLPANSGLDREQAVRGLVMVGGALRAIGAIVAGQLTFGDEDPEIAATVVLVVRDLPRSGADRSSENVRRVVADALAGVLRERHPEGDVRIGELSCGPAVVMTTVGEYRFPAGLMTTGTAVTVPSNRLQVLVPTPDGDGFVVLEMTTCHVEYWGRFVELAMVMANNITFDLKRSA
jgi:hypothetical protein